MPTEEFHCDSQYILIGERIFREFNSVSLAYKWLIENGLAGNIYGVLDKENNTAGGYHWITLNKN